MGRLIALLLLFYVAFAVVSFVATLYRRIAMKQVSKKSQNSAKPPWDEKDVQEGKFEDIK